MDRLSTLLSQFGVRANLFYYGKLCGMASYDGADPRGHIHLLQAGTVTLQGLDRKDLLLTQPSLIFLPRPSRHQLFAGGPEGGSTLVCVDEPWMCSTLPCSVSGKALSATYTFPLLYWRPLRRLAAHGPGPSPPSASP